MFIPEVRAINYRSLIAKLPVTDTQEEPAQEQESASLLVTDTIAQKTRVIKAGIESHLEGFSLISTAAYAETIADTAIQRLQKLRVNSIPYKTVADRLSQLSKKLETRDSTSRPMQEILATRIQRSCNAHPAINTVCSETRKLKEPLKAALQSPRIHGSLQVIAGCAEAVAGSQVLPFGWPVVIHGLDQAAAGANTVLFAKATLSLTEQILHKSGIPLEQSVLVNQAVSMLSPVGAVAALNKTKQIVNIPKVIRWDPLNGPGPLKPHEVNSFRSATYVEYVVQEKLVLYRAYNNPSNAIGRYWSRTPPSGPLQAKIDSALIIRSNHATDVICIEVPKGTKVFEGIVSSQEQLVGGGSQVFVQEVSLIWVKP